ncbi:MAG: TIGR00645 family protein [Pseudorhodoplanes sp.]
MQRLEQWLESFLFNSRWLLAPFYIGLALSLVLLLYYFVVEFVHFAGSIGGASEKDVILAVLALIDLSFTANLVLIVIFSGYENFVSKMEIDTHDRPEWMAKVDFGGLKQKLMTSIVAISAVELLKGFMNMQNYDSTRLAWLVGIHVTFLGSLLVVVIADRISEPLKHPKENPATLAKKRAAKSA